MTAILLQISVHPGGSFNVAGKTHGIVVKVGAERVTVRLDSGHSVSANLENITWLASQTGSWVRLPVHNDTGSISIRGCYEWSWRLSILLGAGACSKRARSFDSSDGLGQSRIP